MEIITSEDDINEESTTHQPDTKPATDAQSGILYSITVHLLAQAYNSYSKSRTAQRKCLFCLVAFL